MIESHTIMQLASARAAIDRLSLSGGNRDVVDTLEALVDSLESIASDLDDALRGVEADEDDTRRRLYAAELTIEEHETSIAKLQEEADDARFVSRVR